MNNETKGVYTESSLEEEHGRYAVSLLPRSMRAEAYNMECMVNHTTGEFLVKNNEGIVLSFNKYTRFTEHMNSFVNTCKQKRVVSKIYEIETNVEYPEMVECGVNLLDTTLSLGVMNTIDKLMLSIDLDTIDITSIISPKILEDDKTKIEVILTCDNVDITKEFTKSQLNCNVFNIAELFHEVANTSEPLACKSIKILPNGHDIANLKCLVSSILVTFI